MKVDVVTAVHSPYAGFLRWAWRSLLAQTHQDWVWLVQIDGNPNAVLDELTECGADRDPRVMVHAHLTREGPATSRNIALGRSRSPLVQNLDADDELEPKALSLLAAALSQTPSAGYAAGQARDLFPDGTLREAALPLTPGLISRGTLPSLWVTPPEGYRVPLHPAGVMWRRDILIRLGGWPALAGMEDTGLLMAASAVSDGILLADLTLRYRIHPSQDRIETPKFAGGGHQISLVRRRALLLEAEPPMG